VKEATKMRNSC